MSSFQMVDASKIAVDGAYQRPLDDKRVAGIVDDFDPALLGTIEVSKRPEGYAVFDGQHRLAAIRRLGWKHAPCLVHEGLSRCEEADLFVKLQVCRKTISPVERFRARLVAGEPAATVIATVVENAGWTVGNSNAADNIGAVSALDRVYRLGGADLLQDTLNHLSVWRGEPRSVDGAVLAGMALAIQRCSSHPNWSQIQDRMSTTPATTVLRRAIASLESGGGSATRPVAVARELGSLVGIRSSYGRSKQNRRKAAA